MNKKGFSLDRATLQKIFTKQSFMLITVVGLLLLLVLYIKVYKAYDEKTKLIQAENNETQALLDELETYYNNMDKYKEDTETIKKAILKVMEAYPADAREEDVVMLAVEMQEQNEIEFEAINMDEPEAVYTVPVNLISMAGIEGYEKDVIFMKKMSSYSTKTDYDNLKGNIEQVLKSPNRIAIDKVIYTKNEQTGLLEGDLELTFYSASGTDKEYVAPDIAEYISGTSDLFMLSKVVNNNGAVQNN